mmetsp:Transcript_16288/g.18120  ORF Transcript_16288/g.18120 Transcript_16288/m.18120 type:complete len:233 (-) Transcript_16288:195-893(-)
MSIPLQCVAKENSKGSLSLGALSLPALGVTESSEDPTIALLSLLKTTVRNSGAIPQPNYLPAQMHQTTSHDYEEPIFVNAKQYHRILKRRQQRAKLSQVNKLQKLNNSYIYESRHQNAVKRKRDHTGRFRKKQKIGNKIDDTVVQSLQPTPSKGDTPTTPEEQNKPLDTSTAPESSQITDNILNTQPTSPIAVPPPSRDESIDGQVVDTESGCPAPIVTKVSHTAQDLTEIN